VITRYFEYTKIEFTSWTTGGSRANYRALWKCWGDFNQSVLFFIET